MDQKAGFWERLDRPTKVLAAIGGTLGGVAAVIAVAVVLWGHGTTFEDAGQHVRQCMSTHGMRAARVKVGDAFSSKLVTFRRCDWPPIFEDSIDGYTQVAARIHHLPIMAAAPYNTVATLRASCDAVDVTFVYAWMYGRKFASRRLEPGRLYEVWGFRPMRLRQLAFAPPNVSRLIPLATDRRDFYVLYSSHNAPFDAHCASSTPPR